MTEWKRVYKQNVVGILQELADKHYQKNAWLYIGLKPKMTISFVEAVNMLFDDCVVGDYLQEGEIIFDRATTSALRALDEAIDAVDEFRPEKEIIDDPLMEVVRERAARVLSLIQASTGTGSTVDIVE